MKYCPDSICPCFVEAGEPGEYNVTATPCSDRGAALVAQKPDSSELPGDEMQPVMSISERAVIPLTKYCAAS